MFDLYTKMRTNPTSLLLSLLHLIHLLPSISAQITDTTPCSLLSIAVRLPPSIDPLANTSLYPRFALPPPNWSAGNWKVTYSSSKTYQPLLNMQFDSYPVLPTCTEPTPQQCPPGTFPGQLVDLTSFHLPNTTNTTSSSSKDSRDSKDSKDDGDAQVDPNHISTAFGYDTPRLLNQPSLGPGFAGVYDFQGTGQLSTVANSYEIVAWGIDPLGESDNRSGGGAGWWVLHETPATGASPQEAALTVESRVEGGPSDVVVQAVKAALKGLGNRGFSALVDGLKAVGADGRRSGVVPVVCAAPCQENENVFLGEGGGV